MFLSSRKRTRWAAVYQPVEFGQRASEGIVDLCILALSPAILLGYYTTITYLKTTQRNKRQ